MGVKYFIVVYSKDAKEITVILMGSKGPSVLLFDTYNDAEFHAQNHRLGKLYGFRIMSITLNED